VVSVSDLGDSVIEEAGRMLAAAPASGNGSTADAPILALAWATQADLWSHDRDFFGVGVACWSTANLRSTVIKHPRS
jgi:hypothetical protein